MKKVRHNDRGSAVIEMAVIAPILLVIMILMIYMGLYLYNVNVLYGDAYLAAFRAVQMTDGENGERYAEAGGQLETLLEGQLIALKQVEREITADQKGVRIGYRGSVPVPIVQSGSLFERWECFVLEGEAGASLHRPVTFIRHCRLLERLLGQEQAEQEE